MSIYNGEPIEPPPQRWSRAQQLELLMWHPLFTGLCPQCRYQFEQGSDWWDCPECGWKDEVGRSLPLRSILGKLHFKKN